MQAWNSLATDYRRKSIILLTFLIKNLSKTVQKQCDSGNNPCCNWRILTMHQLRVYITRLDVVNGCVSVHVQTFTGSCFDYWKIIFRLVF